MKILPVLLLLSGGVLANPAQQEQQINMILTMMEKMGELARLSQCIDVPTDQLKRIFRQTYAECGLDGMMSVAPDQAYEDCLKQATVAYSGIDEARWLACDSDNQQQEDPLMAELDALYDGIGERNPTAAEQQQIEHILARIKQRGVVDLQQMVDAMVAGSQGSEHLITLPLYPEAKLLINIPANGSIDIGGQEYNTLPGASFITTASPSDVLAYYRQQLPAFVLHRTTGSAVALMQSIPPGFDYSQDTGRAFSIEHIYIQPASDNDKQRLAGAKTVFFVYYQPTE